jgi:hypothetical protein
VPQHLPLEFHSFKNDSASIGASEGKRSDSRERGRDPSESPGRECSPDETFRTLARGEGGFNMRPKEGRGACTHYGAEGFGGPCSPQPLPGQRVSPRSYGPSDERPCLTRRGGCLGGRGVLGRSIEFVVAMTPALLAAGAVMTALILLLWTCDESGAPYRRLGHG